MMMIMMLLLINPIPVHLHGRQCGFFAVAGDKNLFHDVYDAVADESDTFTEGDEEEEELDEATRQFNFWTHQIHIFFARKFLPAAEKMIRLKHAVQKRLQVREEGREKGREAGRKGGRQGEREGGRKADRQGGREECKEKRREAEREEGRQGGRKGGGQGGRKADREGGRKTRYNISAFMVFFVLRKYLSENPI
ncbi:hypothetical protein DPMN_092724 [Dreissena polymorpha]|uniref:Uncharacterized protein n=1 Tax=Dreissena polymorpha TaxID=45954 RepID=A0A9D4L2P5_DREPO|nr:hypothetical protein DPMN_092724 [Dreissena polymorpha]